MSIERKERRESIERLIFDVLIALREGISEDVVANYLWQGLTPTVARDLIGEKNWASRLELQQHHAYLMVSEILKIILSTQGQNLPIKSEDSNWSGSVVIVNPFQYAGEDFRKKVNENAGKIEDFTKRLVAQHALDRVLQIEMVVGGDNGENYLPKGFTIGVEAKVNLSEVDDTENLGNKINPITLKTIKEEYSDIEIKFLEEIKRGDIGTLNIEVLNLAVFSEEALNDAFQRDAVIAETLFSPSVSGELRNISVKRKEIDGREVFWVDVESEEFGNDSYALTHVGTTEGYRIYLVS